MDNLLETERLSIRLLNLQDSPFILELLTSKTWLEYIGDRGVKDETTAADYILNGPMASYSSNGYGLFLVVEKSSQEKVGLAGFLKRDELPLADLGFAMLERFEGKGLAKEASKALLAFGKEKWGFEKVCAITTKTNQRSNKLLSSLGFQHVGNFSFYGRLEMMDLYEYEY
ncbi:GNAT family N-acetyltransferase [Mongoliibacter ruber]|uniref:RimJ/RimL family protein N-acetyltransferase n=1 Tax=Mongoliibacter ruber TaxID=1750599 RepID=A0A2T0WN42_9BACT|nr:GNAT family N-acetyltransferase [Mongoliibacter ruber]PRY88116.1 RimJ/RimL family protein N-acetyltransferase [Mongoliibacter ruber]